MRAHFNGSTSHPVVELAFDFTEQLTDGRLVREWVSDLPEREWDASSRAWQITGFGPIPDAILADAGITVVGPDDEPCTLRDYSSPFVTREPIRDMLAVHPRLAGRTSAETGLPAQAAWVEQEHRWLIDKDADFSGQYTDGTALIDHGLQLLEGSPAAPPVLTAVPALPDIDGGAAPRRTRQSTATTTSAPAVEPLVYDGSLDGLRAVPVTDLKVVNTRTAEALEAAGIESVYDLLHYVPRRYVDQTQPVPIDVAATMTDKVAIVGTVVKNSTRTVKTGTKISTVRIEDGTSDSPLDLLWFNVPWMAKRFPVGTRMVAFGTVEGYTGRAGKILTMPGPMAEVLTEDSPRMVPIYPQSGKANLSTWQVMRAAAEAIARLGDLADPIPGDLVAVHGLVPRAQAFAWCHTPASLEEADAGRERLAYDELLRMQLALAIERTRITAPAAHEHTIGLDGPIVTEFRKGLRFAHTGAQRRAIEDIAADMARPHPMFRLLQGDVGAGKTLVATETLLLAVQNGRQSALMAPTETLSFQHFLEIEEACKPLTRPDGRPVKVAYLANTVTGKAKKETLAGLADGAIDIAVGTHALVAEAVTFANLSVAVIDEQHRFGADQRAALAAKAAPGMAVDVLSATATPVPRTAMMTVFGDMDVSILDELPPGRTPIQTYGVDASMIDLDDAEALPWRLIREQIAQGRQAFIVVPLVEKSATREAAAAHDTAERLTGPGGALEGMDVAVVTGKDKPADRRAIMEAFRDGSAQVLVATTVIEVGVNVPNSTVMVILGADTFGIAQMHQLRGRVGRGQHPGSCVLIGDLTKEKAAERVDALVQTTDGFKLSEMDLRLRGWGTLIGQIQSGAAKDLKVADLFADEHLIAPTQNDARTLIAADPGLNRRPGLRDEVARALGADAGAWLTTA